MDSAVRAGRPQLHIKFLPVSGAGGGGRLWAPQAWRSLPTHGFLGLENPRSCPACQTRLPGRWGAPRPAVTHPVQQESGRNVPCALPWVPGPPAPSGRAHGSPQWHGAPASPRWGLWLGGAQGLGPMDGAAEGIRR